MKITIIPAYKETGAEELTVHPFNEKVESAGCLEPALRGYGYWEGS